MDNCNQTPQDHGHNVHHNVDLQADVASSKLAWEAWKSNDPQQIDHALAERQRILKEDPKAWHKAMHEIDAEEKAAKVAEQARLAQQAADAAAAAQAAQAQQIPQAADAAPPVPPSASDAAQPVPPPTADASAQPMSTEVVNAPMAAGYAPIEASAQAVPNTPAYRAAYMQAPEKIYGIDLPFLKLGFTNRGSFEVAPNIGIARVAVKVGLDNRVEGELMPIGGPLHARVGAGVGVNENGFHGEAGAGVNVLGIVGGDADVGARVGRDIGVDGDLKGQVLQLVHGQGDAGASLGANGIEGHGGGNADIGNALGARGGGRVNLGPSDTGASAGVGANVGGHTLDFGPSLDVYPTGAVVPDVHLDPNTSNNATFFPTGDRDIDTQR